MKGRILRFWSACAWVVVIGAFAQSDINQAENPPIADERTPASVTTPTSDADANAAAQPLAPQAPGESPRTGVGTTMQPEPVAPAEEPVAPAEEPVAPAGATAVADQAMIPPEPARKLWRISPIFSAGVVYDDNIFLTNTDRVADVIWTIPFGLSFELGDFRSNSENYVTARWIGIPTFYTNNPNENHFDQRAPCSPSIGGRSSSGNSGAVSEFLRGASREVNTTYYDANVRQ